MRLEVTGKRMDANETGIPLLPFHGFSPVIKSLRVDFIILLTSRVFDLVLSFPHLEDLTVNGYSSIDLEDGPIGLPTVVQPSSLPVLTASFPRGGAKSLIRRFLSLPGGVHFRKLTLLWQHEQDLLLTMALVEACSHTLEALTITSHPFGVSIRFRVCTDNSLLFLGWLASSASIDLSKARKLKDVMFVCNISGVEWVIMTLRNVIRDRGNIQQILLDLPDIPYSPCLGHVDPASVRDGMGEDMYSRWLELDHLLAELWESHSIRPKITYNAPPGKDVCSWVDCLLPELTKRGVVNPIE